MNNICITGRLTKDPELRTTQSGKEVTRITVAVDRDFVRSGEQKEPYASVFDDPGAFVYLMNAVTHCNTPFTAAGDLYSPSSVLTKRSWSATFT